MIKDVDHIVKKCQAYDGAAQKTIFEGYKSLIYGICRRYIPRDDEAKDLMADSFIKIFNHIHEFNFSGSFEGWMKRITVNECLMYLRKQKIYFEEITANTPDLIDEESDDMDVPITTENLMVLLDQLPPGYRTIINMYIIEGYKHREIADILGISINTSKSQLILAKKKLQDLYFKKTNSKIA